MTLQRKHNNRKAQARYREKRKAQVRKQQRIRLGPHGRHIPEKFCFRQKGAFFACTW